MCRFMMVKSMEPIRPRPLLEKFAEMARNSRAIDGDWQGDGWGVGWLSEENDTPRWLFERSTEPVWCEQRIFAKFPSARLFMAHARSSSFPQHKGVLSFNQPFIREPFSFVFNGLIQGVAFPAPVVGEIGSQKIWTLLSGLLDHASPNQAIEKLQRIMDRHARSIQAMNIGLCNRTNQSLYVYSHFKQNPEYYRLHVHDSNSQIIVASEPLEGYVFEPIAQGEVLEL